MRRLLFVLLMCSQGFAATYYVAANGADSNNGTAKTTPWLHAPGMFTATGLASTTTINAGDSIIFRGGDTWHFGNSGLSPFAGYRNNAWNFTASGTSTNCKLNASLGAIVTTSCIYIGVDKTWFSGASWVRPAMNMDNPLSTSAPASCAHEDSAFTLINISGQFTIVDNLEVLGWCWNVTAPFGNVMAVGLNDEVSNNYFHGWTMGTTATGCGACDSDEYWALGGSWTLATGGFYRIDHNVFDGSDSTFGLSTSSASGGMILSSVYEIDHNVFIHCSNIVKFDNMLLVHDNYIDQMYESVVGGTHGNVFEWVPDNYTTSTYYFNNVVRQTGIGETIDMYPGNASNSKFGYIFNNVMTGPNGNSSNCYMVEGDQTGGPGLTQFFNNTVDSPCTMRNLRGNASAAYRNNHIVGFSPLALSSFCGMTVCTDNGNEVFQSEATANAQGYGKANNYSPTGSGNATVGAGGNLTATLCAGMDNSIASAACKKGYGGITYDSSNHIAIDNTATARPTSAAWDVGAYQFSAPTLFSISGAISAGSGSASPNPGVTVSCPACSPTSTTTDSLGAYSFGSQTGGGNYVLTPSLTGYTFSPASSTFNNLSANQTANFTAFQPPVPSCSPSGGIFKSGRLLTCSDAIAAATICWRVGSAPTTSNGTCTAGTTYTAPFMVSSTGTLFVTGTQSGNTDSSTSYSFTINPAPWTTGWIMNSSVAGNTTFGNRNYGFNAFTGTTLATWPAVPNMGNLTKNATVFTDSSLPPVSGTGSPVVRCTDAVISPSDTNKSFSAGLGGSGDALYMFNANSTAMHINFNGNGRMVLFNPATMVCGDPVTGKVITGDKNIGTPGSSGTSTSFTAGSWDATDPSVFYLFPGDSGTQTQKISINPTTGQFCKNGTYTSCSSGSANVWNDYIYGFPHNSANANNAPTWALGQVYPLGQYVTYTMQASDSLSPFVWNATTTYNRGDLIVPTLNNTTGCAFKEMNATGTTSSSQPNWNTASNNCQVNHGAIADGTASWWPVGPPNFIYQLIATSGAVTTATPFVPTGTGHPDIYLTVTDSNGNQWMNVGPDISPVWTDAAFLSADSTRSCTGFSTNSYGRSGNSYSDHGGQGSGVLVVCYDNVANVYVSLNSLTGVQSKVTCSLGAAGGYNCNGGTWTMTPQGISTNVALSGGNCGFLLHNVKGSYTMDYPAVAIQAGLSGVCATTGSVWSWQPFAAYNAATNMVKYRAQLNHWAQGNTHMMEVGQSCLDNSIGGSGCPVGVYGFSTGVYTNNYQSSNAYAIPSITWQASPCASPWTFGSPAPCAFGSAYDSHMGWAYNPGGTDTTPVCGSMYNLATLAPPPLAPWQGELICISTTPTWTDPTAPNPAARVWRFTHEFNTGGNTFFDAQFAISQCSTDGKFCAFTSDWNCTLGTTSGTASGNCGAPWIPNSAYVLNTMINPFSGTGGSGTNFGVWQVTNIGSGTSASSAPTWTTGGGNNCTAGTVVTDANSMQYTCLGASNGRADVFVVALK